MRIFIALDIPAEIRARMSEYMEHARSYAPDARWARVEGLHVTLKFVGEAGDMLIQRIKTALATVKTAPFEVKFEGAGFFPNPKAARVFWIGVNGEEPLTRLAAAVDAALEKLGIAREEKPYHPHLTLARASSHPLRELQPLANGPSPQFGTMAAREFFLYQSQPQRGGSKYTRLERFRLE
ncbi:MAG TPA: RNA 2',3'-cyclic phosphodiesterase [Candidatus Angelobacter sp.]|nr:RNA 2',3'-cyclic phosphodiesterase [Candidatus Angelobacter sp.]